ncbi:Uncharacterised protein [Vibrio cholerae]|nr:Uncharacterised protein [Vibrio cholerae]
MITVENDIWVLPRSVCLRQSLKLLKRKDTTRLHRFSYRLFLRF